MQNIEGVSFICALLLFKSTLNDKLSKGSKVKLVTQMNIRFHERDSFGQLPTRFRIFKWAFLRTTVSQIQAIQRLVLPKITATHGAIRN